MIKRIYVYLFIRMSTESHVPDFRKTCFFIINYSLFLPYVSVTIHLNIVHILVSEHPHICTVGEDGQDTLDTDHRFVKFFGLSTT